MIVMNLNGIMCLFSIRLFTQVLSLVGFLRSGGHLHCLISRVLDLYKRFDPEHQASGRLGSAHNVLGFCGSKSTPQSIASQSSALRLTCDHQRSNGSPSLHPSSGCGCLRLRNAISCENSLTWLDVCCEAGERLVDCQPLPAADVDRIGWPSRDLAT